MEVEVMSERSIDFAISEYDTLLAYPDSNLDVVEFIGGAWKPMGGTLGDWMDAKPITEEEAMRITSGLRPS